MSGQNRPVNSSPAPGSNGRGGHQTGGRGYRKKGYGRYDNNNWHSAQPNGTYGPRLAPEVPATVSFPQGHSAPWGNQYDGHPMPHVADAPPWIPPALGYPNKMQPRGPSGYVDQRSHVETGSTNTPMYTPPIASPAAHITTTAAEIKALPAPIKVTNDSLAVTPTSLTPLTPEHERRTFAMDANHSTLDKTADQLDVEKIISLQVYNISLASKLRQTLQKAKTEHQVREIKIRAMQVTAKRGLDEAIAGESVNEEDLRDAHNQFYDDMKNACQIDEPLRKDRDQRLATEQIKFMTKLSQQASKYRSKIDIFRNELQDLENARARSRNTYSNAIFDVLMKALGAENPGSKSAPPTAGPSSTISKAIAGRQDAEAGSSRYSSGHIQDKQDVSLSVAAKQSVPQPDTSHDPDPSAHHDPVFEQRPEPKHSDIREILDAVNARENPAQNSDSPEKQQPKSRKGKDKQIAAHTSEGEDTLASTSKARPTSDPATKETVASVDNDNANASDNPKRTPSSASLPAKPADSDSDPTQQSSVSHPQTGEKGPKRKKKGNKNKKKKKGTKEGPMDG